MSFYGKIFKQEKEENYEAYVESFGLPDEKKLFLLNYKPHQRFEKDGDNYTHVLYLGDHEKSINFKPGEEFENSLKTTPVKNLYTVDGNTITHMMKFGDNNEITTTIKKEFTDDKLVETITNNKWDGTAKLYYSA